MSSDNHFSIDEYIAEDNQRPIDDQQTLLDAYLQDLADEQEYFADPVVVALRRCVSKSCRRINSSSGKSPTIVGFALTPFISFMIIADSPLSFVHCRSVDAFSVWTGRRWGVISMLVQFLARSRCRVPCMFSCVALFFFSWDRVSTQLSLAMACM